LILWASAAFALIVFFSWLEQNNRPWFKLDDYLAMAAQPLACLRRQSRVRLIAVEVGLALLAAFVYVELHWVRAASRSSSGCKRAWSRSMDSGFFRLSSFRGVADHGGARRISAALDRTGITATPRKRGEPEKPRIH